MKHLKSINNFYLSDLARKIQTLPSDEAAPLLLEGSAIILFAGFPDIAYQGFLKLTQGELTISEVSSLANPLKTIIPALCYSMRLPYPGIFSEQEMSLSKLEKYINDKLRKYEHVAGTDRWFHIEMPLGNWSEDFLSDLTKPKVDITENDRFKVYSFFQDLHRIISQYYINQGEWQEASRWLKVFEDVANAWKIDHLSYVEQEILVFGIRIYLHLNEVENADRFIQRWWHSSDSLISALYLVAYLPDLMNRISEGVLQNKINISYEQAQAFLESVERQNCIPENADFIPTVEDWSNFLNKWNEAIFANLDEEHVDNYAIQYSDVLTSRYCLRGGATEERISELELRLGTKLPLSYRNFLLASDGFMLLNEYCGLYGTEQIRWFIDENRDWAEGWDVIDTDDEKYFQYGEHQDCVWIRGQYLMTALQISSTDDCYVYLLNPQIKDQRNEWEAWEFGSKLPGAYRYRSFWDMMQKVYKRILGS